MRHVPNPCAAHKDWANDQQELSESQIFHARRVNGNCLAEIVSLSNS
jgi:hypothetical protein